MNTKLIAVFFIQIILVTFNTTYLVEISGEEKIDKYFATDILSETLNVSKTEIEKNCIFEYTKDAEKFPLINISCNKIYLFSWDDVPGNNSNRVLNFLKNDLNIIWADNSNDNISISKSADNTTINITNNGTNESLLFKLNISESKVILDLNGTMHEYILKNESGKLNIYNKINKFTLQFKSNYSVYGDIETKKEEDLRQGKSTMFLYGINGTIYGELINASNNSQMQNYTPKFFSINITFLDSGNEKFPCYFYVFGQECFRLVNPLSCKAIAIVSTDENTSGEMNGTIYISGKNCTHIMGTLELKNIKENIITKIYNNETKEWKLGFNGEFPIPFSELKILQNCRQIDQLALKKLSSRVYDQNNSTFEIKLKNLEGYEHKPLFFHWELFMLLILSFINTFLKLQLYNQEKKDEEENKSKKKKEISLNLMGFIFSLVADFHYLPAAFIVVITTSLFLNEVVLLLIGALIANIMSLIVVSYELTKNDNH